MAAKDHPYSLAFEKDGIVYVSGASPYPTQRLTNPRKRRQMHLAK
jgi:hypothetical protein